MKTSLPQRLILILLLLSSSTFTACGDEGDSDPKDTNAPSRNENNQQNGNNSDNNPNNNTPDPAVEVGLDILSPENGATLTEESVDIEVAWSGLVPNTLTFTVNDESPRDIEPSGTSTTIRTPLKEGTNRILFRAIFEGDRTLERELIVVRVNEGEPSIAFTGLVDGSETSASILRVQGVIAGPDEPTKVTLKIGPQERETTLTSNEDGLWFFEGSIGLGIGENALEAIASFDGREDISTAISVVRTNDTDSPVFESIVPRRDHDVPSSRVFLRIDGHDEQGIAEASVSFGEEQTVALEVDGDLITGHLDLEPGWNEFSITLTDTEGNESTESHRLHQGIRLASGGAHGGAIQDGALYTWGRNNKGQVGLGYTSTINNQDNGDHPFAPSPVMDGEHVVSLSFNQNVSLALDASGHVWAWGDNGNGQLGLGDGGEFDDEDRNVPEKIEGLDDVVMIARGYDHSLALDASGRVWAWGENSSGQLGDGTTEHRDQPTLVPSLENIVHIDGASGSSYAIDQEGNLWAWGENGYGNLGLGYEDDEPHSTPVQVPGVSEVVEVATGRDHVLALTESGSLYSWGLNASLQAAAVDEDIISSPVLRDEITGAVGVHANGNMSYIEDASGQLFGWGQNFQGNLGLIEDGDIGAPSDPVFGVDNTVSVSIGALQGFSMRQDGQVFAWGWSFEGSLGGGEGVINRWGYRVPILVEFPTE